MSAQATAPAATVPNATLAALRRARDGLRDRRRALIRWQVLHQDRLDVLASQVLGYEIQPFHHGLIRFQSARKKTLQLAPRGYGKSTILTVARAIHEVLRNPDVRVLICSNTILQAEIFLREIRRHFEGNPVLREVFGDWVSTAKWQTSEIMVAPRRSRAKESTISCVGVGGPAVSRHYDVILADDLIDEENARTEGQRERTRAWFYQSLLPTLEPHGRIHLVGTRYHYLDLYGALIEGEYRECHQVIRALGPDRSTPWPEKFSVEWLEERRRSMGTILFNSQYQNDVQAMKGRIFRADWMRYYDEAPPKLRIVQGVDLAISQRETADYFAHVTIGVDQNKHIYVLDAVQRRLTFQQQTDFIREKARIYDPAIVYVEANAYQAAQIQELERTTNVPVKALTTVKDKISRFMKLSALFEIGRIFLPRTGADELIEQLLLIPEAPHDDLADALDHAVQGAVVPEEYRFFLGCIDLGW